MADILIDVEVRGNKGVTNAVKNVQTLQTNVKRLSDAMKTGALSQRQYYKGIDQLADATGKSSKELRDYATALRKVERETKAAKAAQEQEAAAVKAYAQARREAEAANRRYDAEQKAALATQKQHEVQLERLRQKYNPLYAASKLYERSLEEINQAHKVGAISIKQHEAALESLNMEYQAFANGATVAGNRFAAATQRNTRGIGQMSTLVQQSGYQIGDFLVQIQSGTNWMVAFGQQATQIAGTLTLLGGKMLFIGTALSIAIPLVTALGAAWMRTRDNGADAVETIEDHIKSLREETRGLIEENEMLASGYRNMGLFRVNEEITRVLNEELKIQEEIDRLIRDRPSGFRRQERILRQQLEALGLQRQELEEMVSKFKEAERENEKLKDGAIDLSSVFEAMSMDNILSQMDSLNSKLGTAIFGAGTLSARLRGVFEAGVAAAERAKIQQDQQRARQEGFRFDSTKTGGGISKTQAFFTGQVGFSNIPQDIPGVMTPSKVSGAGSGGGAAKVQEDYLAKLKLEADRKLELVGLSEEEARIKEITYQLIDKGLPIEQGRIEAIVATEEALKKVTEAEKQRQQLMDTIEGHIENAFMSMVDGSKSVEDAFKSMLRNIILAIYQQKVAEPAAKALGGLFDTAIKAIFSANGNVFNNGMHVKAYADGGVVNRATMFPMRSGVGIMGEAGPEAIMPLKRGKNGKLGVQMEGSSQPVVVNQYFNMSANGDESVKRIIRQETPRIAEQAKAAVVDAKRRGGTYGRSF